MYYYMFNIELAKGHRSSTALFTKLLDCLPLAGTVFRDRAPIHSLRDFFCSTGIVPGKAGNGFAGSFVNCTVTALFTKPPAAIMVSVGSGHQSPNTDYEHFPVPLEWYQSKPGSREANGMVNIAVKF